MVTVAGMVSHPVEGTVTMQTMSVQWRRRVGSMGEGRMGQSAAVAGKPSVVCRTVTRKSAVIWRSEAVKAPWEMLETDKRTIGFQLNLWSKFIIMDTT